MPTHYLLTPASRGMGLSTLMRMSDQEIYHLFCQARWPDTAGMPICPACDLPARGPDGRGRYHCKGCLGRFTLTSGTALHGLKLSRRALLLAIFSWVTAVKGISALQLSRLLDIQYGTAFSLCHKLRHALARECAERQIGGPGRVVAVDGVYIGGHIRPANWRENRRDRRFARNQNGKRRVVVIARELGGRTVLVVVRREGDAIAFLIDRILPGTVVHADEAASWNDLHAHFEVRRINHQLVYSDGNACTNPAESLFSRFRRLERGQHHHVSGPHLYRYAVEVAFREDCRRMSAKDLTTTLLSLVFTAGPDPTFRGYHQRRQRGPLGGRKQPSTASRRR